MVVRCVWPNRKNRAGENAKMRPQTMAAATLRPSRRASTNAPSPQSTHDASDTTFIARTGLPVSQMAGAAKITLPIMFSENASVRGYG